MKHILPIILLLSSLSFFAKAQQASTEPNDTTPFYRMSLEELMNVNVTVASQSPMTSRESPGIITIITREEIQRSGAKDLMEVLRLVPGINFSVDVEGTVGISIRGNWANEGKVLLLWDGIELNEELYSTLQFGGHYPIDRIRKIEIIRGPGSAIYGGNAEYAVINIITENSSSDFNGVSASVQNSITNKTFDSRGISLAAGKSFGAAHINLSTSFNNSSRSEETYTDVSGNSYDMTKQSGLTDSRYRLDFSLKGFSMTGMYDRYANEQRDGYDAIYLRSYNAEFNAEYLNAKYEIHRGNNLTITPGIRFKFEQPWSYVKPVTDDNFEPFNTTVDKKEYYLNTTYDPNDHINLVAGLVYYNQMATQGFDTVLFSNGSSHFSIDNYAIYLQSIVRLTPFNLILGARNDYNPYYGSSFVPRIGITKVWDNFHFKTLYSRAFRSPSIENINASPDILPEKTIVAELEAGCRLLTHSYLTVNIFDIKTLNPIVFYYDENQDDKYKNDNSTGTRGIEVDYKWKSNGWYAAVNYSYYTTAGHSMISIYSIPDHPEMQLAFPSHKINLSGNVQLSDKINVNPSVSFMSTRYAVCQSDDGTIYTKEFQPSAYVNLALNFEKIFCKKFSIQAACMNMFDERVLFIQPYNGNHEPLPGMGREFRLRLSYLVSFSRNK